jgi:hypothetical protein
MESLLDQISKRSTKANPKSKATILAFSILILVAGIASSIGGTNYILYSIANAQLEEGEDLREEQSAVVEESATGSNEFSLTLDRAHFIPLSPISDSPGNQVKKLLQYSGQLPSTSTDDTVNAIMEVYAANHTLLRTSSLPEPITLDGSDGTIQLATTFNDPNLKDVTAKALITDSQKINPLSDPIEASIGLGEITSAAVLNKQ